MKIKILGTANAWGPNPFLSNGSTILTKGTLTTNEGCEFRRFRTSLLIESGDGKKVLVDCSPDFGHQVREFKIERPDAILITHPHLDHVGGLDELNLYRVAHKHKQAQANPQKDFEPIDVHATRPCWDTVRNSLGFAYIEDVLGLVRWQPICLHPNKRKLRVGSLLVTPFAVKHSERVAPGAIGFHFEDVSSGESGLRQALYTGDLWSVADPNDPVFSKSLDAAIVECDRWEGDVGKDEGGGHMSFDGVVDMLLTGVLSKPCPNQVVLVHFGDNGPKKLSSSYHDWRDQALKRLKDEQLSEIVVKEVDHLVGYEGMELG